jgi:flagellar motor switch protein FliM
MAGNPLDDQDAIAAQWEASLDSEDPAEAGGGAGPEERFGNTGR